MKFCYVIYHSIYFLNVLRLVLCFLGWNENALNKDSVVSASLENINELLTFFLTFNGKWFRTKTQNFTCTKIDVGFANVLDSSHLVTSLDHENNTKMLVTWK